jgi:putative ABC transport system ATP-binding protein
MSGPGGIRLEAVGRQYATPAGLVRALDGITVEIESGTSVAITGPSGCGKSTLLGLVGGLDVPSEGRVSIGDEEISSLPEPKRARLRRERFGLMFQTDNLLPFLTAVENVSVQLALHGVDDGFERCLELLGDLGLAADAHKLPDQLSGGQRQRVAIARALVHRPQLILADEPTGSLDSANSDAVIELLLEAQQDSGATLVVVTHDPGIAQRLDRTIGLRDGRLAGNV